MISIRNSNFDIFNCNLSCNLYMDLEGSINSVLICITVNSVWNLFAAIRGRGEGSSTKFPVPMSEISKMASRVPQPPCTKFLKVKFFDPTPYFSKFLYNKIFLNSFATYFLRKNSHFFALVLFQQNFWDL